MRGGGERAGCYLGCRPRGVSFRWRPGYEGSGSCASWRQRVDAFTLNHGRNCNVYFFLSLSFRFFFNRKGSMVDKVYILF